MTMCARLQSYICTTLLVTSSLHILNIGDVLLLVWVSVTASCRLEFDGAASLWKDWQWVVVLTLYWLDVSEVASAQSSGRDWDIKSLWILSVIKGILLAWSGRGCGCGCQQLSMLSAGGCDCHSGINRSPSFIRAVGTEWEAGGLMLDNMEGTCEMTKTH